MSMSVLLATWIPFIHPINSMPPSARLWMFFPLAAAVATVYRATRAASFGDLPARTVRTFINIVIGMWLIALGAYGVHMAAIRIWY
jgi:hypothetical protein